MAGASRTLPVRLPAASRANLPPSGSGVWLVIWAAAKAAELTNAWWPLLVRAEFQPVVGK